MTVPTQEASRRHGIREIDAYGPGDPTGRGAALKKRMIWVRIPARARAVEIPGNCSRRPIRVTTPLGLKL